MKKEASELNNKIAQLNDTINSIMKDIINYQNDIKQLTNKNLDLENKLKNMEENNKNSNIKISNYIREDLLISLMEKINIKDNEIEKLKKIIPFDLKDDEKLLIL